MRGLVVGYDAMHEAPMHVNNEEIVHLCATQQTHQALSPPLRVTKPILICFSFRMPRKVNQRGSS